MVAATQRQAGTCARFSRAGGWVAVLCAALLGPAASRGQEPLREEGAFITVPAPLDTRAVNGIKAAASRALGQKERPVTVLVLDFNPSDHAVTSDDYGACRNLAAFLLDLQNINTVAFVHRDVTGHLVLPVLACREIVMAPEARLGDVPQLTRVVKPGEAVPGAKRPPRKDVLAFYEEVVQARARNPALVLKMLDPDVEVIEANRGGSKWYIEKRRLKEEEKNNVVATNLEPLLPAGAIGLYTGKDAQKFELCRPRLIGTRQELARAYDLPSTSLRDPLQGRKPLVRRFEVRGEFTRGAAESLRRRIRNAVGRDNKANFILLELNIGGGDILAAHETAYFLRKELKDDAGENPVMTVAYVPKDASDTAVILALGCTEIVLHKDARFGDFERLVADGKDTGLLRKTLEELANEQGYPPLLMRGFLEPDLVLHRVKTKKAPIERDIVTAEDLVKEKDKWLDEGRIKHAGKLLVLDAALARELGVARNVIQDPTELYTLYGLDSSEVRVTGPDWLDQISEFLRRPMVAVFLIMIGITCLILELKMPGVGLPGVVAALCFVLYFWAHSQLSGQILWLAVLLFLLGLILIGLEIFVIPGFGLTGISGVLLLLVSLALVTLEKKPETSQEWVSFGGTLGVLGLSVAGALLLAVLVARSLPSLPYASRLVLQPPGEASAALEEAGLPDPAAGPSPAVLALLGAIGVAVTPLRPAGIARFGEDFVDVVAESSYVESGSRVQVVEIEGNRVAVKEV